MPRRHRGQLLRRPLFESPESSAPSPDPASGPVSLVSSPQSQSLSPQLVPRRSDSALTARVRPERHQHEVVREPRHGKGRRRAPRLEDSMAARSWPGAGPKLHTWDTPGPLLCGAADQGFRRHLPSQPARPGASGACAVLPLPCRRDLAQCTSIGPLHVGRVQRALPRLLPLAQGPAQPFGRVKLTAAGAGQLSWSRGRHFDPKHRSGLGHTFPSELKPQNEGRPGPHSWESLTLRARGVVQLNLAEASQWSSGLVQPVSQTRGPRWGMGECQGFATHPVNLMMAKRLYRLFVVVVVPSAKKGQLDIPPFGWVGYPKPALKIIVPAWVTFLGS